MIHIDTPMTNDRVVIFDGNPWVNAPFARSLERELNAANVEIERLTAKVAQLYAGAEEQNKRIKRLEEMYEKEIGENDKFIGTNLQALLTRELNAANERIKRLEEALEGTIKCFVDLADSGDAGFWNPDEQSVIIAARAALEAKEAKP